MADNAKDARSRLNALATVVLANAADLKIDKVYEVAITDRDCRCFHFGCFESCKKSAALLSGVDRNPDVALYEAAKRNYTSLKDHYEVHIDILHEDQFKPVERLAFIEGTNPTSLVASEQASQIVGKKNANQAAKKRFRAKLHESAWACQSKSTCKFRRPMTFIADTEKEVVQMARDDLLMGVSAHQLSEGCKIDFSREAFLLAEMNGTDLRTSVIDIPAVPFSEKQRFLMLCRIILEGRFDLGQVYKERYRITLNSNFQRCLWKTQDGSECDWVRSRETIEEIGDDVDGTWFKLGAQLIRDIQNHHVLKHTNDSLKESLNHQDKQIIGTYLEAETVESAFRSSKGLDDKLKMIPGCHSVQVHEIKIDHEWKAAPKLDSTTPKARQPPCKHRAVKFTIVEEDSDIAYYKASERLLEEADAHRSKHDDVTYLGKRKALELLMEQVSRKRSSK